MYDLIDEIEEKLNEMERIYYSTDSYLDMEFDEYLELFW